MTHKLQLVTLDQRGKERIEMSSVSIFTHVLLTAPSHSIAEVYRIQLNILKQSVPFLATSSVVCVSDPEHGRVGSGGGTLNALQQLKIACGVRSYESCRVLVIHSGGESRRAPLNSLCGKAWTSINATVEGDVMASPLLLLIKELNLFCMNLPLGSLVIASSDVTLDIANKSCSRLQFDEHCVFAVAVPVAPSIAKNHGVLVPFSFYFPGRQSEFEGGCTIDHVTRYFQKPTFEIMEENGALFSPHELGQASSDDSPNNTKVALVDTGVVIFCGEALGKLVSLLDDPVVRTCVEGAQQQQQTSASATLGQPLRLELYTDIMLALAVKDQSDFCISEYHHRLGVKASDLPAQSLYKQALPVLWEALKYTPLQVIIVPQGRFEHLGTTAEVLQLLTLVDGVSSTVKSPSIPTTAAGVHDAQLAKLRAFALKYHLRRHVKSTVRCLHPRNAQQSEEQQILAMCINSILMMQGEDDSSSESAKRPLVGEAKTTTVDRLHVLVEHSALSGKISFPGTAIASHICPALGKDLTLRDGIMMQQVHLKLDHERELATPFSLPCAMIVLGISDDVKLPFSHPFAKICGAPWTRLFQVICSCFQQSLSDKSCELSPHRFSLLLLLLF